MLQLLNINKKYGSVEVLKQLNLTIPKGELLGLIGPNGAGKTTLMNLILSNLDFEGKILIEDQPNYEYLKTYRDSVVYIPEKLFVYDFLTGLEFVSFILDLHNISSKKIEDKIRILFELFDLTSYKNQLILNYSFGMKRKITLIAALVQHPKLMLLDEPVFGVDARGIIVFKKLLRHLAQTGVTIVLSTHIIDIIKNLCDSAAILYDKNIVLYEKLDKVSTNEIENKYLDLVGCDVDSLITEFESL
ncbi:MAG: ABC transporter ATP-binding protein [Candidatus Celaenobacter antarcticus]|nr:ABC transporter ATP-binding protein [Candidatus Celaenobacter antarcticus]